MVVSTATEAVSAVAIVSVVVSVAVSAVVVFAAAAYRQAAVDPSAADSLVRCRFLADAPAPQGRALFAHPAALALPCRPAASPASLPQKARALFV